jgi:hypothetical protein
MGTLCVEEGGHERLEYRMLEGSCESGEVLLYLDALAEEAQQQDKPCVVVLANAPFHTAGVIREREAQWETRGLTLYRLPAYCPQLNLIEGVWRRLKGFLSRVGSTIVWPSSSRPSCTLYVCWEPWRFNVHLEILRKLAPHRSHMHDRYGSIPSQLAVKGS